MKALFIYPIKVVLTISQLMGQSVDSNDTLILAVEKLKYPSKKIEFLNDIIQKNYKTKPQMTMVPAQKLL
ncbi:MAG: hypothetical protein MI921_22250 [Cytophagales bacterium]|nr:hypothetical protein [Cytophagales bacterium]